MSFVSDFEDIEPVAGHYLVEVYPPQSAWLPEQDSALEEALGERPSREPLGLFVYVPFCQKKCHYCYYLSFADRPAEAVDQYLDSMLREAELYASFSAVRGRPLNYVFIGGGTPSVLTPEQVCRLGAGLRKSFSWAEVQEVTFECAPGSVRPELLEAMKEIGVTRVSMGVQSFDDVLLKLNGRIHLKADVLRAYATIREAGVPWVNLDLMVGLLGEKPEKWRDTIQNIIKLAPESVTIYQTEIPYNTQLYREFQTACLPAAPATWDTKRARLLFGFDELELAGYTLISAYSAVKDPVRHRFCHQECLWDGADRIGLGLGTSGYFKGVHYQNSLVLKEYQNRVQTGRLPLQRACRLSLENQCVREFILQLKRGWVSQKAFQKKFGADIGQTFAGPLQELQAQGMLVCSKSGVQLTRAGLLRVDRLLPRFYEQEYLREHFA